MKITSIGTVLVAALFTLPVFGQQASREEFKELCQLIAGRWLGDVTLVADWAGVGKKGERIVAHAEITLGEDGHVALYRGFFGSGSETGIRIYDTGTKQITERGGDSGGGVWMSTYAKKGGKWMQSVSGSDANGVRFESERTWEFSKDGRTVTISGAHLVGGKKVGDLRDTWRRTGK